MEDRNRAILDELLANPAGIHFADLRKSLQMKTNLFAYDNGMLFQEVQALQRIYPIRFTSDGIILDPSMLLNLQKALSVYFPGFSKMSLDQFAIRIRIDFSKNSESNIIPKSNTLLPLLSLDLSYMDVRKLPLAISVTCIQGLKSLNLSNTQLNTFPNALLSLTHLETIDLSKTQIAELPDEIQLLHNLVEIRLEDTPLTSIPSALSKITNLRVINIAGTRIKMIPEDIYKLSPLYYDVAPKEYNKLNICIQNALKDLDHGILTSSPAEAYRYWTSIWDTTKTEIICEAKITLLGAGDAGKTSLVDHWLRKGKPAKITSSTNGMAIAHDTLGIDKEEYQLHFWDLGGQKTYHPFHTLFFSPQSIYIIVLNGRNDEELPDEWLQYIGTFAEGSPTLLVLNKLDERPRADINSTWYIEQNKNIFNQVFKMSCLKPKASITPLSVLQDAVRQIISANVEHYRLRWPKNWAEVRDHVIKMYAEKNRDYISHADYNAICIQYGVTNVEDQETILAALNRFGAALTFRGQYAQISSHVLNPNWVCEGIYKILDADIQLDGVALPFKEFKRALSADKRYSKDGDAERLLDILKDRKLCLDVSSGRKTSIFMPAILPAQRPVEVLDTDKWLTYVYRFQFLPPSLMHSLLVSRWTDIKAYSKQPVVWRSGAMLTSEEGVEALIEEGECAIWFHLNPETKSDKDRLLYLHVLRDTLNQLLHELRIDLKSITQQVKISVPPDDYYNEGKEYIDYATLLRLHAMEAREFYLPKSLHKIVVTEELGKYWIISQETFSQERSMVTNVNIETVTINGPAQIIESNHGMIMQNNNSLAWTDQQASQILEILEAFQASKDAKKELTGKQRKSLRKDLDEAKAAKSEERQKIILTILQGLTHVAAIGASVAKILSGAS